MVGLEMVVGGSWVPQRARQASPHQHEAIGQGSASATRLSANNSGKFSFAYSILPLQSTKDLKQAAVIFFPS